MGRETRVDDEEMLREIILHPDPVITSSELSERIHYSADGARRRLEDLESKGLVHKRKVGANAVVWWPSEDGRHAVD
jgi:predicted ArsR family transcriptional regulator